MGISFFSLCTYSRSRDDHDIRTAEHGTCCLVLFPIGCNGSMPAHERVTSLLVVASVKYAPWVFPRFSRFTFLSLSVSRRPRRQSRFRVDLLFVRYPDAFSQLCVPFPPGRILRLPVRMVFFNDIQGFFTTRRRPFEPKKVQLPSLTRRHRGIGIDS